MASTWCQCQVIPLLCRKRLTPTHCVCPFSSRWSAMRCGMLVAGTCLKVVSWKIHWFHCSIVRLMAWLVARSIYHCFLTKRNTFMLTFLVEFPPDTVHLRLVLFQEAILRRFGFIPLQENVKKTDVVTQSREFVSVTGKLFNNSDDYVYNMYCTKSCSCSDQAQCLWWFRPRTTTRSWRRPAQAASWTRTTGMGAVCRMWRRKLVSTGRGTVVSPRNGEPLIPVGVNDTCFHVESR